MPRRRPGGNALGNGVFPRHNLLQTQAAQRHNLLLHMRVCRQNIGLGIVIVIILGDDIAGPAEIGGRHPAGVAQIPAHMVGVEMGMHHKVDLVRRGDIGVQDVHIGREHNGAQFLVQVAGQVAPAGMRPRPHTAVHQDYLAFRPGHKDAVVKLQLAVLQGLLIVGPGAFRHLGKHRGHRPRRRHHIDDRRNFVLADGNFLCHKAVVLLSMSVAVRPSCNGVQDERDEYSPGRGKAGLISNPFNGDGIRPFIRPAG